MSNDSIYDEMLFQAYNNLGIIYAKKHNFKEAVKNFDNAISINTIQMDIKIHALINKAYSYALWGYRYESLEIINKVEFIINTENKTILEHNIKGNLNLNSRALYIIGYIFYINNEIENAKKYLQKSELTDANSKYTFYQLGKIYLDSNKNTSALEYLGKAIEVDENFAECYNARAFAHMKNENYHEAINELKKAIEIKPSIGIFHENLVKVVLSQKSQPQTFWDFWNSSKGKRIVLIGLTILTGIILLHGLGILPQIIINNLNNGTNELTYNSHNMKNITTIKINDNTSLIDESIFGTNTNQTKGFNNANLGIPESYLILIGLIIFVIIFPQLRSAKLGQLEFELIIPENMATDTKLNLNEDDFYTPEEFKNENLFKNINK